MDVISGGVLLGVVPGVLNGDVRLVAGKQGKALYTNGLDQWVNLGNQRGNCMGDLNQCNTGFVMALWLQMHRYHKPGTTLDEYYLTSGGHTRRSMGVVLLMRDKRFLASFRTASWMWYFASATENNLDIWYHVVLAWDASKGGRIYVNGMTDGADLVGTSYASNKNGNTYVNFILGCENVAPPRNAAEMTLDELRIWDANMNDQQVWRLYVADAFA